MLRLMQNFSTKGMAFFTATLALLLFLWDLSGLDLAMAQWFGNPAGFALQDNWLLTVVLHDGARRLAWALALLLCVGVWRPVGWLQRLGFHSRLQLALTTLVAVTVISSLKSISMTSCPWSLAEFGGVAHYMPHWSHLFETDGGNGGCFPAGHASSGFAFLGGYFALRRDMPALAVKWLVVAVVAGLALGIAQQMRGAHFMSHTLWTGWICWVTAWAIDAWMSRFNFAGITADLGEGA